MHPAARDTAALAAIARGDVAALGRLYDRYGAGLYRLALSITGDLDAAEAVVETAFLAVWRDARKRSFRGETLALELIAHVSRDAAVRPRAVRPWLHANGSRRA